MVPSLLLTSSLASILLAEELGAPAPRREPPSSLFNCPGPGLPPGLRTGSSLPGLKETEVGPPPGQRTRGGVPDTCPAPRPPGAQAVAMQTQSSPK